MTERAARPKPRNRPQLGPSAVVGRLLMALSVALEGRLRRGEAARNLLPSTPVPSTTGVIHTTHGLTMATGAALARSSRGHLPSWAGWLGVGIMAGGLGLRIWSWRAATSQDGSPSESDNGKKAVDAVGPYARVRHPGYLGSLAAWLGYGLALRSVPAVIATTVPNLIVYTRTIKHEEAAMAEALGDDYRAYQARTARLVPSMY